MVDIEFGTESSVEGFHGGACGRSREKHRWLRGRDRQAHTGASATSGMDIARSLRAEARRANERRLLVLAGDPDRTRQILTQLVTNAVKFSDRGEIGLAVRPVEPGELTDGAEIVGDRRYLSVSVEDRGDGIPRKERERVFEPFHQASRLLNRSREGSGLGLAIARRLARRQGGDLMAGGAEDGGSRFTLLLPRAG